MEELRPLANSTIQARIQRIRERMAIEKLSGVPATNREEFLAVCEAYERYPLPAEYVLSVLHADAAPSSDGGKDWQDWCDWSDFTITRQS